MMLGLYRLVMSAFEPFAPGVLLSRARAGKEDPRRLGERFGNASIPRPDGPLVWLHGVSVGESLSLLPLIARIRAERPDVAILVTSGTVTSAALLAKRLPDGAIHQFIPIDGPRAVAKFLDHWRPNLALFAESELWPNLILGAKSRGIPLALVSARITDKTAKRWQKRPKSAAKLLSAFRLILPQDAASAERLVRLGAAPGPTLNLKYVGDVLPADPADLGHLRMAMAGRDVVLAASTHPGEERRVAEAFPPGPLLVIVPRHPDRAEAIEAELHALGRQVARRSMGAAPGERTDVYLADTLGELGLFFRLADLIVMGGSLEPGIGGHNPLEPARLGKGVVSGSLVHNFDDVYRDLADKGGAMMVEPDKLKQAATLLQRSDVRAAMGRIAEAYATSQTDQFEAGWGLIKGLLP